MHAWPTDMCSYVRTYVRTKLNNMPLPLAIKEQINRLANKLYLCLSFLYVILSPPTSKMLDYVHTY